MWHSADTNDYLTAVQALIDIATSDHVATVAVNAGGTGYAVDDVLTVVGGTSTYVATLLVTSVSSGVIDGVRVLNGGAYTADPTLTANAATGGTGSGATFDLTTSGTGWTVDRREYRAARISSVGAGGSGYVVGDFVTIAGGTSTEAAVFEVTQVSSGAIVAVTPVAPTQTGTQTTLTGKYSATPANPASIASTTGSGTGATLNIEYEQELIMEGSGSGSQDITVGIKTYQDIDTSGFNTTFSWSIFGMGSYDSGNEFWEQSNISPGFSTTPAVDPDLRTTRGAYVPLRDFDATYPITFWFNITPRRIIAVFKVESVLSTIYPSMHIGYLNQLGTTTELAFPMYVAGAAHRRNAYFDDVNPYITGLTEMVGGGGDNGPGFYYRPFQGEWAGADNSDAAETGNTRTDSTDSCVYPGGEPIREDPATGFVAIVDSGWGSWEAFIPDNGVPGTAQYEMYPCYGGSDLYWLVPCAVMDTDDNIESWLPLGEIDDVFWVGRAQTLSSEDTITIGSDRYRVFQNGNRTEEWSFMAIKENF